MKKIQGHEEVLRNIYVLLHLCILVSLRVLLKDVLDVPNSNFVDQIISKINITITKLILKHSIPILKVSCNKNISISWIWPWVGIKWYFAGYRRMGSSIVGRKLDWDPSMFVDIKLSLYTWNWLWAAFIQYEKFV